MRVVRLLSGSLRSPLLWGGLVAVGFYSLVHAGVLHGDYVNRYFASHPVEYVTATMFFVGLAALVIKALDVMPQFAGVGRGVLAPRPERTRPAHRADELIQHIDRLPRHRQSERLVQRIREAVQHVDRTGSADGLDDELKYLAEYDAAAAHSGYELVAILIWAIPILGFLGTVIGITLAIAKLSPQALENSLPDVTAGLGVAFDTTALALGLSMILMFAKFLVGRAEGHLLAQVDRRATEELTGQFEMLGAIADPQVAAVRRIGESMLVAVDDLVRRQTSLWRDTIEAAHNKWEQQSIANQEQVQAALDKAVSAATEAMTRRAIEFHRQAADEFHRKWVGVQATLGAAVQAIKEQQVELVKQGEILLKVVEATGQVAKLEEVLNRNLSSLAGSQKFEEAVHSLAAAVHLLTARSGHASAGGGPVKLDDGSASVGHAA